MSERLKVYLAGPEVFLPDAAAVGQRKQALCEAYGFEGLFPFDNEPPPGTRADLAVYRANRALIAAADLGIANLTPFRGPSADAGTVFELGLLLGLGKPAFAYTNEAADYLARVTGAGPVSYDAAAARWRDAAGLAIEDFGNADNLMIAVALAEHGRPILSRGAGGADRLRDLAGFEACLRQAAATRAALIGKGAAGRD